LKALKASAQENELTIHNVSVGVVSLDEKFHNLNQTELAQFIQKVQGDAMQIS